MLTHLVFAYQLVGIGGRQESPTSKEERCHSKFTGGVAWRKRTEGIPGYERTYPPHWRQ